MHAPNPSPLNTHPVLAEATRGGIVESFHRGALAIVDADGAVHTALGDVERPIFPRSAVKVLQALPLVESGAADRLGLTDEELAIACASHGGEERHARTAAAMLAITVARAASFCTGRSGPLRRWTEASLFSATTNRSHCARAAATYS
jgi:L-asparaginase II